MQRLKQPSTWIGIAVSVASIILSGGVVTPEIALSVLSGIGLVTTNA